MWRIIHIILFKVKCTRVMLSGWRCQGLEADSQLWYQSPTQFQHSQRLLQAIIIFKKVWKGKSIAVFRFGSAATSNLQIGCDCAAFLVMILVLGRAAGSARSLYLNLDSIFHPLDDHFSSSFNKRLHHSLSREKLRSSQCSPWQGFLMNGSGTYSWLNGMLNGICGKRLGIFI